MRRKNAELEQANQRIEELLRHDALTGLYNRRYLAEYLPRTIRLSKRNSSPLSLIICDIDHFKTINDTWGHDAGDTVLVDFSRVLSSVCRAEDIIIRYGGEEFIVVLEFTDVTCGAVGFRKSKEGNRE